MGGYFAGEEVSFCVLELAGGSALRASYFLLLRQKKVSKEKATPGSVSGYAGFPALLETLGGWLNSPAAQTTPADCPRHSCVARHLSRGPVNQPCSTGGFHFGLFPRLTATAYFFVCWLCRTAFRVPMWRAEQRRRWRKEGEDCLRGAAPSSAAPASAEFRSPRQCRVAQGTRRSRVHNLGSPFLWLLSFGEAKESTPARKAEPQANHEAQITKKFPCSTP
jgi:hypothetical protein